MNARRLLALWTVPVLVALGIVAASAVLAPRLPDPIAIHWGMTGAADDAGPLWPVTALIVGVWAVVWVPIGVVVHGTPMAREQRRMLLAVGYGAGGFLLTMWVAGLWANRDLPSWGFSYLPAGQAIVIAFLVALPLALLGYVLGTVGPDGPPVSEVSEPVRAEPGAAVPWTGSATGRTATAGLVLLPVAVLALSTPLGTTARWTLVAAGLVTGLVLVLLGRVKVAIGPDRMRASLGLLGVPRVTVPVDDIEAVLVEQVAPMAYGGSGYRVTPGVRALVVRAGPGIRVRRRSGTDVVVTVDGAAEGAAVLAAHVDRAGAAQA